MGGLNRGKGSEKYNYNLKKSKNKKKNPVSLKKSKIFSLSSLKRIEAYVLAL